TMYSGEAFTPGLSYDPTNTGSGSPRPDVVADPYNFGTSSAFGCPGGHRSLTCWYNPAAYAVPPLAPGQTFATEFGNAGPGTLRGPAEYNLDSSIFKQIPLGEALNLELRAEVFNVLNTPEFGLPDNAVDTAEAGSITGTIHSSRQIQFAAKFLF
ncbi:MAG TPA: hypothetical protein VGG42_10060, partial [Acidobacteriaceae bacterium]